MAKTIDKPTLAETFTGALRKELIPSKEPNGDDHKTALKINRAMCIDLEEGDFINGKELLDIFIENLDKKSPSIFDQVRIAKAYKLFLKFLKIDCKDEHGEDNGKLEVLCGKCTEKEKEKLKELYNKYPEEPRNIDKLERSIKDSLEDIAKEVYKKVCKKFKEFAPKDDEPIEENDSLLFRACLWLLDNCYLLVAKTADGEKCERCAIKKCYECQIEEKRKELFKLANSYIMVMWERRKKRDVEPAHHNHKTEDYQIYIRAWIDIGDFYCRFPEAVSEELSQEQVYAYNRALVSYHTALDYEATHHSPLWAAVAYHGLGDLYYTINQMDGAKDCYEFAMENWNIAFNNIEKKDDSYEIKDKKGIYVRNNPEGRNGIEQIAQSTTLYASFIRTMLHYGRWHLECGQNDEHDLKIAIKYFDQVLELQKSFSKAYVMQAKAIRNLYLLLGKDKKNEEVNPKTWVETLGSAKKLYIAKGDQYKAYLVKRDLKLDSDGDEAATKNGEADVDDIIKNILRNPENAKIEANIIKKEREFSKFLSEKHLKYKLKEGSYFLCLQRWNSFTPIIDSGWANTSKGGGYFIKTKTVGIVIDPGFNFIENFISAGYRFADITHVLISHAHNDHTTDLESLLALLNTYNKFVKGSEDDDDIKDSIYRNLAKQERKNYEGNKAEIEKETDRLYKKSPRRKRIELLLSPGAKRKFEPLLKRYTESDYTVHELSAGDALVITGQDLAGENRVDHNEFLPWMQLPTDYNQDEKTSVKDGEPEEKPPAVRSLAVNNFKPEHHDVQLRVLWAKHDDLSSDRDSLGFWFTYAEDEREWESSPPKTKHITHLLYTGDTGYSKELGEQYKKISKIIETQKEDKKESGIEVHKVLLAHLGSIKSREYLYERFIRDKKVKEKDVFYQGHLGRLGIAKLANDFEPDICLVSEFGEEFRGKRKDFVEMFKKAEAEEKINDKEKRQYFPIDIGFCLNAANKIGCVTRIMDSTHEVRCKFVEADNVVVEESESALYYRRKSVSNYTASYIEQSLRDSFKDYMFTLNDAERVVDLHSIPPYRINIK